MTWDDFYDRYCDWSESTIKTRISSLEDIGAGEDVVDVVLNLSDEKLKVQLVRKAIKLDVNFTQDDFMNLDGELPDEVYTEIAKHGGFYLGSIGGPAAILAQNNIKSIECVEYPELGMEAIWKIEVEDFPAFILVDDKGNDFFKQLKPCAGCTIL